MPLGTFWLQCFHCKADVLLASTADGELHDHDRQSEDQEEQDVDQHERGSSVLSRDEREPPDITQADRTTCGQENKPDATG